MDGTYDRTRALLELIISKPKLLDKHLSKPPMRFLHDIISAVRTIDRYTLRCRPNIPGSQVSRLH